MFRSLFNLLLTLLRNRVTYRFLLVLAAALGVTTLTGDITQLEALVCSLVSCID